MFYRGSQRRRKSTFIKLLFREIVPTTGTIILDGQDIPTLTRKEIPYMRRKLGIIFQDFRLLPDRTVYDNIAFAMQVIETPYRQSSGAS